MLNSGHGVPLCRPVAGKLVGDHDAGRPPVLLQQLAQQPLGGLLVASALDQNVEDDAGLVDSSPQPMLHSGNLERDLIQMPFVTNPGKAATDLIGEPLAEFARPLPHGFVADDDATRGQQLLHHAQPERETEVQPDGMADDLGREAIPGVAGTSECCHPTRLLTPTCRRKRDHPAKLTVPSAFNCVWPSHPVTVMWRYLQPRKALSDSPRLAHTPSGRLPASAIDNANQTEWREVMGLFVDNLWAEK